MTSRQTNACSGENENTIEVVCSLGRCHAGIPEDLRVETPCVRTDSLDDHLRAGPLLPGIDYLGHYLRQRNATRSGAGLRVIEQL